MFARVLSLMAPEHFVGAGFQPADYRSTRLACRDGAVAIARCVSSVTVTAPEDVPLAGRAFPGATEVKLYRHHDGHDDVHDDGHHEGVWTGGSFLAFHAPRLRHLATDLRILDAAMALAACDLPLLEDLELESISSHEVASALLAHASWPALRRLSLRVDDAVADHFKCTALGVIIASANLLCLEVGVGGPPPPVCEGPVVRDLL